MQKVGIDDWIVLGIPDDSSQAQYKLIQMKAGTMLNVGKRIGKIKSESLAELPYYSHWELDEHGRLIPFVAEAPEAAHEEFEITGDNREINDDNRAQTITSDQINDLKIDASVSRTQLIETLVQGSTSFEKKTEFSQQKYLKKKNLKYRKIFKILPSSSFHLYWNWFGKMPDKILGMRQDTLSQILSIANVRWGTRALVFDETKGMLALSVLERMHNCQRPSYIVNDSWMTLLKGPFPNILYSSSYAKQYSSVFYNLPVELLNSSEIPSEFENEGARQKYENIKMCLELYNNHRYDMLIIASNEIDFVSYVSILSKGLDCSRPLVVYSQYRELLIDCYTELMKRNDFINVHIHESFLREYQVLPGRMHPVMRTSSSGGYLLTAIKIKP